jgi:flagellar biosynthesis protein FlhB
MAQQGDRESQTEDATEKKILDEVEKGNIPVSREAAVFATMLALLAIAAFMARDLLKSIGLTLELLSSDPGGLLLQNSADAVSLFSNLTWDIGKSLIPMLAILLIAGLASSFLQHPPRMILDRIQPDWKRISLVNGWHRIFSARGQADFIKGVCKLVFIGILMWTVVRWQRNAFFETMTLDPDALPELILMIATRLLSVVCILTLLLLAADLLWVRMHWRRDIQMSKQEIKNEMKEAEGDPLKKARLRSLALDRRCKSMIAAVPRATLIIANPEEGSAPLVLSKGKDLIALKIREIAEKNLIPIIEDKLLARTMYDSVEVDRPIPPEFYKAVAELIHVLYAKNPLSAKNPRKALVK